MRGGLTAKQSGEPGICQLKLHPDFPNLLRTLTDPQFNPIQNKPCAHPHTSIHTNQQVFDYPSVTAISEFLATEGLGPPGAPRAPPSGAAAAGASAAVVAAALNAEPAARASSNAALQARVREVLAGVLGGAAASAGELPAAAPLMTAGLNSAAAVRFTSELERSLGASLPATLVRGLRGLSGATRGFVCEVARGLRVESKEGAAWGRKRIASGAETGSRWGQKRIACGVERATEAMRT
eukprot:362107-Chlamydomonas_euryale.AAC.2